MKKLIVTISFLLMGSLALLATELQSETGSRSFSPIDASLNPIVGEAEYLGEEAAISGLDMSLELELTNLLVELMESGNDPEVQRKVMQFMTLNKKYFTSSQRTRLSQQLLMAKSPDDLSALMMCDFKNPATAWVLNFFVGFLGIDQFYIGRAGLGVIKLITIGGFGIWWFLDLFFLPAITKGINYREAMSVAVFM